VMSAEEGLLWRLSSTPADETLDRYLQSPWNWTDSTGPK